MELVTRSGSKSTTLHNGQTLAEKFEQKVSYRYCIKNTLLYLFEMKLQFCGLSKSDSEQVVCGSEQPLDAQNLAISCMIVMHEKNN